MTVIALTDGAQEEILRRDILPLYFPDAPAEDAPSFVLIAGQPGAGRSRALTSLRKEHGAEIAVLNGDELRAFHPGFTTNSVNADGEVDESIAQAVAGWVSACIRHARENRHSIALEGTFGNPTAAAGTAQRFADAGFTTRVVVFGSARAESLLTVTSSPLRDAQAGRRPRFTTRTAHDAGLEATRGLVASLEESPWADRVTVLGRDGGTVFDATRDPTAGFSGASAALRAAQSQRMGRFDATQWLSELHHVTQFATTARGLPDEVTELLVDLHETSLREVIPQLHVPAEGKFATAMEQKTVAMLVTLRTLTAPEPPIDIAVPVIAPTGPERGGLSR
ncbi:zeta toxin family protein [Microbacterium sp. LWH7-1.2]|uniref:zeta toxin family protein n=1 Tax=Microbacterium sp. LWH7-1.2 TaxID=3135257 RepID=UPI00313A0D2D